MRKQIAITIVAVTAWASIASGQHRRRTLQDDNAVVERQQARLRAEAQAEAQAAAQAAAQAKRYKDLAAANAAAGAAQAQQDAINSTNIVAKQSAAREKALKLNQEQAAKGDAYGLLRMGERYRDGDGVPKDTNKAREYFVKAVDAGSPTAADALARLNRASPNLNQASTNSPAKP